MRRKGNLITIEGGDGSGKTVQTELLVKALQEKGVVTRFDFPRYEKSIYGKLLKELLVGKHGDFLSLSPYVACLPFALDRVGASQDIKEALQKGHVICNRYTPSNIGHQCAKLPNEEWSKLAAFIEQGEYGELGVLPPDFVIYLYVPAEIAATLIRGDDGVHDQHEKNLEYQEAVGCVYREFSQRRDNWALIDCAPHGKLLLSEDIHQEVMNALRVVL